MKWQAVTFSAAAFTRIEAAATFERRIRMDAFLDVVADVGPFKLRQMTALDFIYLEYIENNLITSKAAPDTLDFVSMLWQLRPSNEKRNEKRFAHFVGRKLDNFARREIQCFITSQLNDLPASGGGKDSGAVQQTEDPSVAVASLVDQIANEYGWAESDILNTPIARLLQYAQRIAKRALGDKYAISNPITQQARAQELKQIQDG
jgi:hypothetical protein